MVDDAEVPFNYRHCVDTCGTAMSEARTRLWRYENLSGCSSMMFLQLQVRGREMTTHIIVGRMANHVVVVEQRRNDSVIAHSKQVQITRILISIS